MVEVISKNTFISFAITSQQEEFADSSLHHHASPRSRSAESVRDRTFAQVQENLTHDSMQRLNAVLSVGMSSPRQHQPKEPVGNLEIGGIAHLSDLKELQEKLGKALAMTPPALEVPLQMKDNKLTHLRNASNCSLSTMAPDDASECGSFRGGLGQMRHVWSSGSVNTMASDWVDCMSECDETIEFQLSVEEEPTTPQASVLWPDTDSEEESQPNITTQHMQLLAQSPPEHAVAWTARPQLSPEFSHCLVPRNRNWDALKTQAEKEKPPTTLMIRNIPSRLSQQDLVMELGDLGFAGTFDFLYIPMDKSTCANVGYAFVNFIESSWAGKCMERFQGHCFTRCRRGPARVARVSVAHLQGLDKNLEHYENSAVNMSKQTQRRPLVLTSIGKTVA
jgi:hypothetical protein